MGWVGNKMSDLGAEIFPNGSAHVVNQIHQALLKGKEKSQVQFSVAHSLHRKTQLQYTTHFKGTWVQMTWKTPPCQRKKWPCRAIYTFGGLQHSKTSTYWHEWKVWFKPSLQLHSGSAQKLISASTSYSMPMQLLIHDRIIHRGPAEGLDQCSL